MRTVWKIRLQSIPVETVLVPDGAEFVHVEAQGNAPCIWFLCDPSKSIVKKQIATVGTGQGAPEDGRYLGSASLYNGDLMLHLFERA